jgi:hypothetical protein
MVQVQHEVADTLRRRVAENATHERLPGDGNGRLRADK